MSLDEGRLLLEVLARRWRRRRRLARGLSALAAAMPAAALAAVYGPVPWAVSAFALGPLLAAAILTLPLSPGRATRDVVRHLDRVVPELQDSSELLLESSPELTLAGRLQRRRALGALAGVDPSGLLPWSGVTSAAKWLALSATVSVALASWAPGPSSAAAGRADRSTTALPVAPQDEAVLHSLTITVEPPSYTGRPEWTANELAIGVEEGAAVTWAIRTAPGVDRGELVFDDKSVALDTAADGVFSTRLTVTEPRLYHLRLDSSGAEAYRSPTVRLEVVPDLPPVLDMRRPEPFTEIGEDGPGHLEIELDASDDYGLTETAVRATLAAGSGESVEFREERFDLTSREPLEGGGVRLGRTFDLKALGVEPGTELYFFVEAFDNRRPERNRTRTATHIVRVPGDRGLSVDLGDGIPMLTLPEYFRSQRQIILDTEKLLAERGRISEEELERRSQELGFDQGALRTRYGALLGLEIEDGRPIVSARELETGEDHGQERAAAPDHARTDHAQGGEGPGHDETEGGFESDSTARIMEELPEGMVHLHDSAEISTFFTSEVKTLLRACLQEMWEAELHLRLFEPAAALPPENRALRLLKRAQQAERVYVKRIGFDAPVVRPERRLTGDLGDIESQLHGFETETPELLPEVRRALEIVGGWRRDPAAVPDDFAAVTAAAARVLARRALKEEGFELEALDRLRLWSATGKVTPEELETVERALWRLLPEPPVHPARRSPATGSLFESYRARREDGGR